MKSASERLNEAWQTVSAELYRAASEKAPAWRSGEQARPGREAPNGRKARR